MGGIYKERDAVVVEWDKGHYDGPVRLVLTSTSDTSETLFVGNAGFGAVTYPKGYSGSTHVEVIAEDTGDVLDSFDITV